MITCTSHAPKLHSNRKKITFRSLSFKALVLYCAVRSKATYKFDLRLFENPKYKGELLQRSKKLTLTFCISKESKK